MSFRFQPFSRKQRQLLNWWRPGSGVEDRRIVLADGAIRSGKTVAMILSFLLWSLDSFRGQDFILAGVTSGALARNVLGPMLAMLETLGIPAEWKRGEARLLVGGNSYYLFGADKDNAQDKLQGMTAAGAYADEAALFPRSFIDQMIGRCSVEGSRIFLNCNPNGAYHYLKTDFIDRAEEIGLYRLHFTMDDNLTLSPQIRESYARSFSGVFYRQYILGEWVSAEGAVYPMWDDRANTFLAEERGEEEIPFRDMRRFCAVDYGTVNPCVFHHEGVLLGLRRPAPSEDRRGVRRRPGALPGRGPEYPGDRGPQRRQLQGGTAEPRFPGAGREERRPGGRRHHGGAHRKPPGPGGAEPLPRAPAGDPQLCLGRQGPPERGGTPGEGPRPRHGRPPLSLPDQNNVVQEGTGKQFIIHNS